MSNLIQIELMQSTWDDKHWMLCIDGLRCGGPDAGPWSLRRSFSVPVSDIERVLADRIQTVTDAADRIDAMESVLGKIGQHLGVEPGDVDGLLAAVQKIPAPKETK